MVLFGGGRASQGTVLKGHKSLKQRTLHELSQAHLRTMGNGADLKQAVLVPEGENENDWLATHVIDFYNHVLSLYNVAGEFCTETRCPAMTVGRDLEFLWQDAHRYPTATKLPAPQYVEELARWVEEQIDNDAIFPPEGSSKPYPPDFRNRVSKIFSRYFRVFAHIYHAHYQEMTSVEMDATLNTSFKHLVLFVTQFKLVSDDEMAPLRVLVDRILKKASAASSSSSS